MKNNNEAARINLAAVNNVVGRTFAAGNGKVLRAERTNFEVCAIVGCLACNAEYKVTIRKLGDLLRYPNERLNFQCANLLCPSRTNTPAATPETDVNKMSAAQYRAAVVEPEFNTRQAQRPVPIELQRTYGKLYNAFARDTAGATEQHPQFVSRQEYLALDAATRQKFDAWAESVPGAFVKKVRA